MILITYIAAIFLLLFSLYVLYHFIRNIKNRQSNDPLIAPKFIKIMIILLIVTFLLLRGAHIAALIFGGLSSLYVLYMRFRSIIALTHWLHALIRKLKQHSAPKPTNSAPVAPQKMQEKIIPNRMSLSEARSLFGIKSDASKQEIRHRYQQLAAHYANDQAMDAKLVEARDVLLQSASNDV